MHAPGRSGVEVRTGVGVRLSWLKLFRLSASRISHGPSVATRGPSRPSRVSHQMTLSPVPCEKMPETRTESFGPRIVRAVTPSPGEVLPLPVG